MTREYQRQDPLVEHVTDPYYGPDDPHYGQTAICTNDERCQAAADEHDPHCPVEEQLMEEIGF